MNSKSQFATLEAMCRERAELARKEMEYWLAEAKEWSRLRESSDPQMAGIPIQLDWCPEPGNHWTQMRATEICPSD
jgi:hypothetical protein